MPTRDSKDYKVQQDSILKTGLKRKTAKNAKQILQTNFPITVPHKFQKDQLSRAKVDKKKKADNYKIVGTKKAKTGQASQFTVLNFVKMTQLSRTQV